MVFSRTIVVLPFLLAIVTAAPRNQAASTIGIGDAGVNEQRQVRAAPSTVSMAVHPDGHASPVQRSEPVLKAVEPVLKEAEPKSTVQSSQSVLKEAEPVLKVAEPKSTVESSEKVLKEAEAKPHIVAAQADPTPAPSPSQKNDPAAESAPLDAGESKESSESWKSAFFFFASLVLIVVLAALIIARIYFGYYTKAADESGGPEKVGLKAAQASASAAALQQHLNDTSSTSDSGEKIAMLFDRVRQSLEDLSDAKGPGEHKADVAGGAKATNSI